MQQQKLLGQGQWIVINVIRQVMPMAAAISHALFSQRQNGTAPGFRNPNIELAFFFTMPVWKGHQPPGTVTSRDKSSQPWQAHISALSCQAGPHPRWARRVQGGHACPLAKPGPLPVSVRPRTKDGSASQTGASANKDERGQTATGLNSYKLALTKCPPPLPAQPHVRPSHPAQ